MSTTDLVLMVIVDSDSKVSLVVVEVEDELPGAEEFPRRSLKCITCIGEETEREIERTWTTWVTK